MKPAHTSADPVWRKGPKYTRMLTIGGTDITLQLNIWKGTVSAVIGGKQYTFRRRGFWKMTTEITGESGDIVATYVPRWTGEGALSLNGRAYNWKYGNWWGTFWKWQDEQGRDVQLHTIHWHWFRVDQHVARALPLPAEDEAILAAFGWFLQYLYESDGSGSSAVVIAS